MNSTQAAPANAPVAAAERLEIVDVLRGFALLGILLVNITAFKSPGAPPVLGYTGSLLDELAVFGLLVLVESKFFTLFSFLFGLGFAIQLLRAQQRNAPFGPRFARRLFGLFLFGAAHIVLLWEGDILLLYALVGGLLLLFRDAAPRTLLIWSGLLLGIPVLLYTLGLIGLTAARALPETAAQLQQADLDFQATLVAEGVAALKLLDAGSYEDILIKRLNNYATTSLLLLTRVPSVLAMFLLGLYVGKLGIVQSPGLHRSLLRQVRRWGLSLGLIASLLVGLGGAQLPPLSALFALFFNQAVAGPLLALGYAAALVLLLRSPVWLRRFRPLAVTGRMALTNYLMQSLSCVLIFYGFGLGLAGQVQPAAALLLAVGIYAGQIAFSQWWLSRFRFGPLEWLWRSFTYLRWQPLCLPAHPLENPEAGL
jgi:uncharacterized protein